MTLPSASVTKPGTVIAATRLRARISCSGWGTSGGPVGPGLLDGRPRAAGPRLAVAAGHEGRLDALQRVERGERLRAGDVERGGLDLRAAPAGDGVARDDLVAGEEDV